MVHTDDLVKQRYEQLASLKPSSLHFHRELAQSLVEIGSWIRYFESRFGRNFDHFATDVMRKASGLELKPLPSGRSFDMMLFSFQS